MNFLNLKTGRGLVLLYLAAQALVLVLAVLVFDPLHLVSDDRSQLLDGNLSKAVQAHAIKDEVSEMAATMQNMLLTSEPVQLGSEFAHFQTSATVIGAAVEKLDISARTPEARALMDQLDVVRMRFVAERNTFVDLIKSDRIEAAKRHLLTAVRPAQQAYVGVLDQMVVYQAGVSDAAAREHDSHAMSGVRLWLLLIAVTLAAGSAGVFFATCKTVQPVAHARRRTDARIPVSPMAGQCTLIPLMNTDRGENTPALRDQDRPVHLASVK